VKTLTFCKAERTLRDVPIEDLALVFSEKLPEIEMTKPEGAWSQEWQRQWSLFYQGQADRFLDALERSAPGGFRDALFGALCARKASVYRVTAPTLRAELNAEGILAGLRSIEVGLLENIEEGGGCGFPDPRPAAPAAARDVELVNLVVLVRNLIARVEGRA
jgi:hypothetical protein